jgi:hypothetical protein
MAGGGVDLDPPPVPGVIPEVAVSVRPPRQHPISSHQHFDSDFDVFLKVMVERCAHRAPLDRQQRRENGRDDQQD